MKISWFADFIHNDPPESMEKRLAVLTQEREKLSVKEYVMKQKIFRDIFMQADVVSIYLRLEKEY